MGRSGSFSPARARRTASDTAWMASSWPTTRSWRRSSIWMSLAVSPSMRRVTGIPVHAATISAMSSAPTSSLSNAPAPCRPASVSSSVARRSTSSFWVPYLSSAAVAKSASRSACSMRVARDSNSDFVVRIAAMAAFSASQRCFMPPDSSSRSASSFSRSSSRAFEASSDLLAQRLAFDLELDASSLELVELDGHRIDLHAQPGRGLVDEVDRLVRQEAIGDVAVGQGRGGDERGIGDADAVVDLVSLAQAAQDRDGLLDRRLVHEDRLEAPLQCGVLLDVLAVFVEGRGADRVQFAPREHRLQQVRGVHRALGRARSDDRMELVDEQDDLALGVLDLLEDGLEPLLELAAELGAGDERAQVQRDDPLVLERLGHVAADDALGEALRRWPSCRRPVRRSGPGCSWSGETGPG